MRRRLSIVLALAMAAVLPAPALAWPAAIVDPETEARAAAKFLESLDDADRIYVRLASTYAIPGREQREFETLQKLSIRQLTLSPNRRVFWNIVPGSDTLWWIDMRSFGWNDAAWRAVALRDKTFRQPWVSNATALRLRRLVGENQPAAQNGTFHVIALVDAFALNRRTYQTLESPDYYDMLFAEQRYPLLKGQKESREVYRWCNAGIENGKPYKAGFYCYLVDFPKRGFRDFPKDEDEWLTAFSGGLSGEQYESALRNLRSRRGAVCRGMEDTKDPDRSFVAKNNRLVMVGPALTGIGRLYGETFDVKVTKGKRDLDEHAFTDQNRDKARVIRDGGELIFSLPAGDGIATLLVNAVGKRVEEVPPNIATHTRDPRDRTVRNGAMACLACHGDAYGWIPLANSIERRLPDEVDLKFKTWVNGKYVKDRQAAEDFDSFFIGWQDDMKPVREQVKVYWQQATGTKARGYQDGWTGAQVSSISLKWKHRYDDAVDFEQMVRETGAPEPFLRIAASKSTLSRSQDVARRESVPRPAWDEDVYPELMKLLHSKHEREILKP